MSAMEKTNVLMYKFTVFDMLKEVMSRSIESIFESDEQIFMADKKYPVKSMIMIITQRVGLLFPGSF